MRKPRHTHTSRRQKEKLITLTSAQLEKQLHGEIPSPPPLKTVAQYRTALYKAQADLYAEQALHQRAQQEILRLANIGLNGDALRQHAATIEDAVRKVKGFATILRRLTEEG